MNTIEANKALVRNYLALLSGKGLIEASKLTSPDATWWIQGNWTLGGTFTKQQLIQALQPIIGRLEGIAFEINAMTAEDDRVSVDMTANARSLDGKQYHNTYHLLFFVRDGAITRIKEFTDTLYANDFFFGGVTRVGRAG